MKNTKVIDATTASEKELRVALKAKSPIGGIHTIASHENPHMDEIAIMAACRSGEAEECFPGIKEAEIGFLSSQTLKGANKTGDDLFLYLLRKGILLFGTGKGIFDEHGKEEGSALKLFVKYLGKEKDREFRDLLPYVDYEDSHGSVENICGGSTEVPKEVARASAQFAMPELIKNTWRQTEDDQAKATMLLCFVNMLVKHIKTKQDFSGAIKEVRQSIEYHPLHQTPKVHGKKARLVVIRSDNKQATVAGWYLTQKSQTHATLAVLQIQSDGTFQLHSNQKAGVFVDVRDTLRLIRVKELQAKKIKVPSHKSLVLDVLLGSDVFFQEESHRLFNGSLTQTDVPPIIGDILSEEELVETVKNGLSLWNMESSHASVCGGRNGICPVISEGVTCPRFAAGLHRCIQPKKAAEAKVGKSRVRPVNSGKARGQHASSRANTETQLGKKLAEAGLIGKGKANSPKKRTEKSVKAKK